MNKVSIELAAQPALQRSWLVRNVASSWDIGLADVLAALRVRDLANMLAWNDIRQRYRRSKIGPFWLTIGMAVNIITIGFVFSSVLKTPLKEFLPFICLGLIIWGFISQMLTEGAASFISAEHIIKQTPLPLFVHVMRIYSRCSIIFFHNLVIFPFVLLALGRPVSWAVLLAVPGFILLSVNLLWVTLLLAVFCTRYRDLPPVINNVVQIAFFFTPIIWMPGLLPGNRAMFVHLNPIFHLVEIVRAPLLGTPPDWFSWAACIFLAIVGWGVTIVVFGRFQRRIAYWL